MPRGERAMPRGELGSHGDALPPSAREALERAARDDESEAVRDEAFAALARPGVK